jgi:GNAT superfamily N-acetyltransferase
MVALTETLEASAADIENILSALVENEAASGRDGGYQPFSVLIRDDKGEVTGGLHGYQLFDWLFIQYVAVPVALKGRGLGTELMARAEAWARSRGLVGIWLDTFAFQAKPFYERLGFSVFGTIEDHPRGSRRYFLHKRLAPPQHET